MFKKIFVEPSSSCNPGISLHCCVNVYFAKSMPKISSCVIKIMTVDGKCLYFVSFPDFKIGVSSIP